MTATGLSEVTVKVHRSHVMKKMAALSIADLVRKGEILASKWINERGGSAQIGERASAKALSPVDSFAWDGSKR
jgi:hypothetical protein